MLTNSVMLFFFRSGLHIAISGYVTANLRNQIFPEIPREYHQIFLNLTWNNWSSISEIPGNLYAFQGFPGFSKRFRVSGEYLVPQIRCNIQTETRTLEVYGTPHVGTGTINWGLFRHDNSVNYFSTHHKLTTFDNSCITALTKLAIL